ncbi:aminoacyl-tRNA deacylase [Thiohalophilus thiocyanatoxydans]|uniref:Ala-tRNA(Pro) deacylase n=1 Tax=Thiohalophilus thiocyanatoxydans TaxID=381308 RepID=A0A4R8IED5_9GAMM|nr:YbaK/EbsC family protein [Thiohalophilus thiocyanatoxydans]TDX96752.1 Ala-tRNA(Pro) deacylase [Thiohalophilus thiocyanatoxydans]
MTMSLRLLEYLEWKGVDYELLHHPFVTGSLRTAAMAHVPGRQFAKSIVLKDEQGYLVAIVPASHKLDLDELNRNLNRSLHLATEKEIAALFDDCSKGAIPPLAEAYGYDAAVDETLEESPDVYFEAGDHAELVHVSGDDFRYMMHRARHGHFSHPT